jgi:type IV pilus assembly protein PilM
VPRNPIDAVVQALKEAGVKPYIVDLKPLALARAANKGDALIVDLEPDCFDVVLVANGIPTVMHTITPRGEGANLEDNIRRLTEELSKTVEFYNSSHRENPLSPTTPLLLTGELATDATASNLIQAEIEYPIEPLVPPLKFPPAFPIAPYATNIGLVLKKAPPKTVSKGETNGFHDINLNILSDKYRVKARPLPMRYIFLPLAMIAAGGLLFTLLQLKSQANAETSSLQAGLENVSQALHQARLASNEATQIENTINEIVGDTAAIKQEHAYILSKRGDYASTLQLVTSLLPSSTYCTSLEMSTDQITVKGETDYPGKAVDYAEALEKQRGFSEVRVANIGEVETSEITPISFIIVITK